MKFSNCIATIFLIFFMNSCGTFGKVLVDSTVSSFKDIFNIDETTIKDKTLSDNASWVHIVTNKDKPIIYVGDINYKLYADIKIYNNGKYQYIKPENYIQDNGNEDKSQILAQKVKENLIRSLIESKRVQVTEFEDRANYRITGSYRFGKGTSKVNQPKNSYDCFINYHQIVNLNINHFSNIEYYFLQREHQSDYPSFNAFQKISAFYSNESRLLDLVNYLFPLKADILSINKQDKNGTKAQEITINVGINDGVKPKMKFLIYAEIDIVGESTIKDVGEIEVTSVNSNSAICKVKKGGEYVLNNDAFIVSYSERPYKFSIYDLYK